MSKDISLDKYPGSYKGKNICSFISYKATNKEAQKLIDQIWFTGSFSKKDDPSTATLNLNLLLADGNRKEFISKNLQKDSFEDLLNKADEWIDSQLKK